MFPRLPPLPGRLRPIGELLVIVLGLVLIGLGITGDDRGFVIMGTIVAIGGIFTAVSKMFDREVDTGETEKD